MEFRIEPRLLSFGVGSRNCDATKRRGHPDVERRFSVGRWSDLIEGGGSAPVGFTRASPAEWRRLAAIRKADVWPKQTRGPLFLDGKRGTMRGARTATYTPFDRYAAGKVIEAKAERLAIYAKYKPPRTRLGPGELEDRIQWGMREAEKEFPGGKQTESERIIRYLVRRPERLEQ